MKNTPLGTSDFKEIIAENRYYVDKTLLVRHVLEGNKVTLLCRPRRFGKTLNLNMLRCFFAKGEDNARYFEGLAISRDAESMQHLGQHPAIFISFKDVKARSWKSAFEGLSKVLLNAWSEHKYLFDTSKEAAEYYAALKQTVRERKTDPNLFSESLVLLTTHLSQHHQAPAVLLIDEYDTPAHEAWLNGYYEKMIDFLRPLLSGALKDNLHLKKGVLTGILRIAKESMFSGLNNFIASTVMDDDPFSDMFGFTEPEVLEILRHYGLNGREMDDVRTWYDGYRFGRHTIYNPWSLLNYAYSINHTLDTYWVNTSENRLLRSLLFNRTSGISDQMEALMLGQKVNMEIEKNLIFSDLATHRSAVWSMLLQAGYLRCENPQPNSRYDLSIPNYEVREVYRKSINSWTVDDLKASTQEPMLQALLNGHTDLFEGHLSEFVERVFSYYDTTHGQAEHFYHAFFLGLLARYEYAYHIRSNREAGKGRYDIALFPKNPAHRGVLIEIKAPVGLKDLSLDDGLDAAENQLLERRYDAEMTAQGIQHITRMAIAVRGKEVRVREVE
jgi:Predicted AAA-ATPase/PD-(D/E)XK nuclease superfamily